MVGWDGSQQKPQEEWWLFLGGLGGGVRPKVARKLLVEKPLFGMGHKKHRVAQNCMGFFFHLQKIVEIFGLSCFFLDGVMGMDGWKCLPSLKMMFLNFQAKEVRIFCH